MTDAEYLIEGERVALGPLRRDLAETYARCIQAHRPPPRRAILAHGVRWDELSMDALASEFEGSVLAGRPPSGE